MTWRPVLIIFDLFPNFDMPDMSSFQSWMAVLLARSSLSGKSKHRSCQRALLATFPQESVSAAHVFSEQKKLWARCFNVCLSSESKMLIVGTFSDVLAIASCLGVAFEVFWWPPAMQSVPQWVALCLSGEFCSKSLQRTGAALSAFDVCLFFEFVCFIFSSMTRTPTGLT